MALRILLLLFYAHHTLTYTLSQEEAVCIKTSICTCKGPEGIINLVPLAEEPNLIAVGALPVYWFTFNPCKPFTVGNCKDALMCETIAYEGTNTSTTIGSPKVVHFLRINGKNVISYSFSEKTAWVTLVCTPDSNDTVLTFTERYDNYDYNFNLESKHACYIPTEDDTKTTGFNDGGVEAPTSTSSLSAVSFGNYESLTEHYLQREGTTAEKRIMKFKKLLRVLQRRKTFEGSSKAVQAFNMK